MRPVEILLVEDSPTDILLTREALHEGRVINRLQVAESGEDALKLLRRQEPFGDAARPDLILLDLNLPGIHGQEVLEQIKTDDDLKRIPVVVLTTSKAEADVFRAYGLHANCYLTKPVVLQSFGELLRQLEDYWLCLVVLPPGEAGRLPLLRG
jgi:two-component system, chemotaxis family, response regulator Rcp1